MATYYVDSAASPGGDGSYSTPWDALSDVENASLLPGDTVLLKRGSMWRENMAIDNSGTAQDRITFGAYGTGDKPQIRGLQIKTGWVNETGNLWYVTGIVWQGHAYDSPQIVLMDETTGSRQSAKVDLTEEFEWFWDTDNSRVYIYSPTDPATRYTSPGVEFGTNYGSLISFENQSYLTFENIELYGNDGSPGIWAYRSTNFTINGVDVVKGARTGFQLRECNDYEVHECNLEGYRYTWHGWRGIYAESYTDGYPGLNISIHDNTVTAYSGYGISCHGKDYAHPASYVSIYNNTSTYCSTGIYTGQITYGNIHHNTCHHNYYNGIVGAEQYNMACSGASYTDFHHNDLSYGHQGFELWSWDNVSAPWYATYGPSTNVTFHHNKIHHSDNYGFLIYEGCVSNSTFYDNLIYLNQDAGMQFTENTQAGTGNTVYHNTLYKNDLANTGFSDIYVTGPAAGWTFKNNIAFNTDRICFKAGIYAFTGVHNNNNYYRASGTTISNAGTTYTQGQVINFEPSAIVGDPLFVSMTPDAEDFHLQFGSPCINAAEEVGVTTDYYDNGRV